MSVSGCCTSVFRDVCTSVFRDVCTSVFLGVWASVLLGVCISVLLGVCASVLLGVCASVLLGVCTSVLSITKCLSVVTGGTRLFAHKFVCVCVCVCVCMCVLLSPVVSFCCLVTSMYNLYIAFCAITNNFLFYFLTCRAQSRASQLLSVLLSHTKQCTKRVVWC